MQKYAFRLSFGSEKCVFAVPVQQTAMEITRPRIGSESELFYVLIDVISTVIDSSARRPNHTSYTDETTSLSMFRWEMFAPVVTFKNSVFALDIPKSGPIFVDRRGG